MRSLRLAAAAFLSLAWAAPARGHGVSQEVERRGDAWAVRLRYESGRPLAGATYQVLRPGETDAVDAGKTAADGWVVFRPDVGGTWRVKVVDRTGHGRTVAVVVEEVAAVQPSTSTTATAATSTPTTTTTTTASATSTPTPTATPTSTSTSTVEPGPSRAGVVLTAAGIVVFFLVMRRLKRRNRAGR